MSPASTLGPESVGLRVVVRRVVRWSRAPSGRPLLTDVLGVLEDWGESTLTVRTEDGEWEAGEYTLRIAFDGQEHTCSFVAPDDFPPLGSVSTVDCTPTLGVFIQQEATCTEHRDGNSHSQSCTPIPNQYRLEVTTYGTPSRLEVAVDRDGTTLVDHEQALAYEVSRPNGPECDPICRQANVEVTVP